jgi:hypothetical protein
MPVYSPDTQAVPTKLIQATQTSPGNDPVKIFETELEFGTELSGALAAESTFAGKVELLFSSLSDLVQRREPMVFLKQFPAPDVPGTACYQSIVEMDANATAFHGACLLPGEWQIDIAAAESHPIAGDLGLPGNSVKSAFHFWVSFDMIVGLGQNVWTAQAGSETT